MLLLCCMLVHLYVRVWHFYVLVWHYPGHRVYVASANVGGVGAMHKNNTMSSFYFVLPVPKCVVLLFARFSIISTHPCVTIFVILHPILQKT